MYGVSMIDLQPMFMCSSWESFHVEVPGSNSNTYIVSHGYKSNSDYQFGYSCTCKDFEIRSRKNPNHTCKHIKKVLLNSPCLWHQQIDGGEPEILSNAQTGEGTRCCPRCGEKVLSVICGV